jgi:hypothetical protein
MLMTQRSHIQNVLHVHKHVKLKTLRGLNERVVKIINLV